MIFKEKENGSRRTAAVLLGRVLLYDAVPKGGGMDLSVRLFERVAAISGVELLKKTFA